MRKLAIKIGNSRISAQVNSRIRSLGTKYKKENKEGTEKARSKWPYLNEMNELFGNKAGLFGNFIILY